MDSIFRRAEGAIEQLEQAALARAARAERERVCELRFQALALDIGLAQAEEILTRLAGWQAHPPRHRRATRK